MSSSQSAAAWASASSLPFFTSRRVSSFLLRARLPIILAAAALAEDAFTEAFTASSVSPSSSSPARSPNRSSSSSVTRRMSPSSSLTRNRPFFRSDRFTSSTRIRPSYQSNRAVQSAARDAWKHIPICSSVHFAAARGGSPSSPK